MLTNDSVDVFMLQRLQLKQGLYNEAMKSGAESLDVSDIDTAELKTALITDPAVRAEIVTVQEREKLQLEKTQIEADLSFVMRKYEAYNKLVEKLENAKRTIKMYREWAQRGDEYWAQRAEREEAQLPSLENEIEEEKQNLLKKGVNVDDIVRQTEQAQNAIAAIQEKIDNLKEFQEELTQKFREESEAKAKEQGDLVSTYIKERKAENKGGFYKIRPEKTETKATEEETEDDVLYRSSEDIEAEYPNWLEGTTTDSGKHSTQVEGTRKTYKKVADWIEENMGKDVAILDASSGMGYGTADLRERGFNIEDVEPYQSAERKANNPSTYSSYADIAKKYDFIISNAVLNVIPDNWRANVLHDMAARLKVGGQM
jgi:chromosome segregation ATPase